MNQQKFNESNSMKKVVLTADLPEGYVLSNYITAFNQYAMPSGESIEIKITEVTLPTKEEIEDEAKGYDNELSSFAKALWMPEGFKAGVRWIIDKLTK